MIPRRFLSPAFGAALALSIASAVLTLGALAKAIALEPLPAPRPMECGGACDEPPAANDDPKPESPPASQPAAAVDNDPFRPARSRPAERFRMPGERLGVSDTARAVPSAGSVLLIGTAVIGDGGFAMCRRGTDSPKLVRVGERIGDLTLRAVRQGRATFRDGSGAAVELRVAREPQTVAGS